MDPHVSLGVLEYRDAAFQAVEATVIRELPLRVVANGDDVVTLQCTGMEPRFLTAGYLFGCSLIEGADDILSMDISESEAGLVARLELRRAPAPTRGVSLTSGMGRDILIQGQADGLPSRPGLKRIPAPSGPYLQPETLLGLARELRARSGLYRLTRGCHNAALCSAEGMLIFRSDIGRHNAIDTLVGQCLLENIPVEDKIIVSTGRIASEIAHKAIRAGVGVYASPAVATSQAVETARACGLTLIGNVTEDTFWVYNDPGRLKGCP